MAHFLEDGAKVRKNLKINAIFLLDRYFLEKIFSKRISASVFGRNVAGMIT